jgi:D-beta-D-heptose 7-phosphate kinase/D-beta-D-heptose 1-phosphate adenosyltransferase
MKIVPPQNIASLCEQLHTSGGVVVLAHGVFDLLHPGHIHHLREARKLGTHLLVALHTDDSTKKQKGIERPLVGLEERMELLAALEMVSFVTWVDGESLESIVRSARPDVLVNGTGETIQVVESAGGRCVNIPLLSGHATSNIVERITKLPRV